MKIKKVTFTPAFPGLNRQALFGDYTILAFISCMIIRTIKAGIKSKATYNPYNAPANGIGCNAACIIINTAGNNSGTQLKQKYYKFFQIPFFFQSCNHKFPS